MRLIAMFTNVASNISYVFDVILTVHRR